MALPECATSTLMHRNSNAASDFRDAPKIIIRTIAKTVVIAAPQNQAQNLPA